MNELAKIQQYVAHHGEVQCYPGITENKIQQIFLNLSQYEKPDLISNCQNCAIAIEHFEFDGYINSRRGSNYRRESNRIQRAFTQEARDSSEESVIQVSQMSDSGGLEQYFENFRMVFSQHIEKIPQYIKRAKLKSKCDQVEMWFFAEDITPLGSLYDNGAALCSLLPFSENNTNIFRDHQDIAGIMMGVYINNKYQLIVIPNNPANLEQLQNRFANIKESQYVKFQPKVASFAFKDSSIHTTT